MKSRARITLIRLMISACALAVACLAQKAADPPSGAAAVDPEVDKILTRLENRDVHDLHAKMTWSQTFVIEEGKDQKKGELWYKRAEPASRFLVEFHAKIDGRRADTGAREKHLFDGVWYEVLKTKTNTIERTQVRRANDPTNPFELGQGQFPIPFGQRKDGILNAFDVTREPKSADDPPDTARLKLIPHRGTREFGDFARLDFWIALEGKYAGLPVKVEAHKKDGTGAVNSKITVEFEDIELNAGLADAVFKIEVPPGVQRLPDVPLPDEGNAPPRADKQPPK